MVKSVKFCYVYFTTIKKYNIDRLKMMIFKKLRCKRKITRQKREREKRKGKKWKD